MARQEKYSLPFGICHEEVIETKRILILEAGGSYVPTEETEVCKVVVCLPTQFTGGELIVKHNTIEHKISFEPMNLGWVTAELDSEGCQVASGTQILVEGHLFLGDPGFSNQAAQVILSDFVLGPLDDKTQQHYASCILNEMEDQQIGLLLSDQYSNQTDFSLDMLKYSDSLLVKYLKEGGASIQMQMVIYCQGPNAVYHFSQEHLNHLLVGSPEPAQAVTALDIPFIDLNLYESPLYQENTLQGATVTGQLKYYIVPALIIQFPNWWTRARLLWIAMRKNKPEECPVAGLPKDVVKLLCDMLRGEAVESRKRKREEEEYEESE